METIIAIAVITIATLATTTLVVTTIATGRVSQARIEAVNLAREGVEIVRGIRDNNWLKADQNVIDKKTGTTGTTTAWDDTGQIDDGYVGLGSDAADSPVKKNYLAELSVTEDPATCQIKTAWKLVECTAATGCDPSDREQTRIAMTTFRSSGACTDPPSDYFTQGCQINCRPSNYTRLVSVQRMVDSTGVGTLQYLLVVSTVTVLGSPSIKPIVAAERLYDWK